MVELKNKKGTIGLSAILIIVVLAIGGIMLYDSGKVSAPSLNLDGSAKVEDATQNVDFYVSTLTATNTTLFTVTTSGSGENKEYLIEVDADTLGNSARTETFTVGVTNVIEGAYDDNFRWSQEVFVPFSTDVLMSDTSDVSHVFLRHSASTIDSAKTSKKISLQGVTEVQKTLSLSINPNSADLGTMVEINDVGESKSYNWDFGQSNKITLKVLN